MHPDFFPHEDGFANYFNDYDTNLPECYSVSTGKQSLTFERSVLHPFSALAFFLDC